MTNTPSMSLRRLIARGWMRLATCGFVLVACSSRGHRVETPRQRRDAVVSGLEALVPLPATVERGPGDAFTIGQETAIAAEPQEEARFVAHELGRRIRHATG